MKISTAWLKQSSSKTGRDHLGVQGPCINIYGQLLPGITNVTDRARYYTFYPWFFWACHKRYKKPNWDFIIEKFRRADCLFTLIAARHSKKIDEPEDLHGISMVGRETLVPLLDILNKGESIKLSKYATLNDDTKDRYFKNKLGGLGQYYAGPLLKLGILGGNSGSGFQYTFERGEALAKALDSAVNRELFFKTIDDDQVTLQVLDDLYAFCPCRLKDNNDEQSILTDHFFDRNNQFETEGIRRRETLSLFLHLISELSKIDYHLDHQVFRACVYTKYLPDENPWKLPKNLDGIRESWCIFQKNELLSIATQGAFCAGLNALKEQQIKGSAFLTIESFADWFTQSDYLKTVLGKKLSKKFSSIITDSEKKIPSLYKIDHPFIEIGMAIVIIQIGHHKKNDGSCGKIIQLVLGILSNLIIRSEDSDSPYKNISLPDDYFWYYPINLNSFSRNSNKAWPKMKLSAMIKFLVGQWGFENHFRVALRKLRYDQRDTFQVRPTDSGLEWKSTPEPIYTNPRFVQGIRMLWDIDLIEPENGKHRFRLTKLGRAILKEFDEN